MPYRPTLAVGRFTALERSQAMWFSVLHDRNTRPVTHFIAAGTNSRSLQLTAPRPAAAWKLDQGAKGAAWDALAL